MDNRQITFLDGSLEERTNAMKDYFGLSTEQSFQDLDVDVDDDDNEH